MLQELLELERELFYERKVIQTPLTVTQILNTSSPCHRFIAAPVVFSHIGTSLPSTKRHPVAYHGLAHGGGIPQSGPTIQIRMPRGMMRTGIILGMDLV